MRAAVPRDRRMTKGEGEGERRGYVPFKTQKNGKANGVCGLKTADFAPRLWYNSRVRPKDTALSARLGAGYHTQENGGNHFERLFRRHF